MNHPLIRIALATALVLNTAPVWAAVSSSAKMNLTMTLTDLDTGDLVTPSIQFGDPTVVEGFLYSQNLSRPHQRQSEGFHDGGTGTSPFDDISASGNLGNMTAAGAVITGPTEFGPHTFLASGSTGVSAEVGKSIGYETLTTNLISSDYSSFTLSARSSVTFLVDFELDAAVTPSAAPLSNEVANAGFNLQVSPSQATIFEGVGVNDYIEAASNGLPSNSLHSSRSFTFENSSANPITAYWLANAFARGSSFTTVPEAGSLALVLAGLLTVGALSRRRVSRAAPSH